MMQRFWTFVEQPRPACTLGFFRIAFFVGLIVHFGPGLLWLDDNYDTALMRSREWSHFLFDLFPELPTGIVIFLAGMTLTALTSAAIGYRTQLSSGVAYAGCYAFASFNGYPVQTLALVSAWAVLTLFTVLPGADDAFSVSSGTQKHSVAKGNGPLVTLILFQLLLALWFAGIEKLLAGWPGRDEMALLLRTPRGFLLRDWIFAWPALRSPLAGTLLSWATLFAELLLPWLILWRRTRIPALVLHGAFFIGIVSVLQVPPLFFAIFFFGPLLVLDQDDWSRLSSRWTTGRCANGERRAADARTNKEPTSCSAE